MDIVIPSSDEWEKITKKEYLDYNHNWDTKKELAIWRGSSTGCETSITKNPRLHLAHLSYQINSKNKQPEIIDFKINTHVKKLKVNQGIISYLKANDTPFKLQNPKISMKEQTNCKYIFNVEGNVSAYRYSYLFGTNSLIINVNSDYYMWFEPLLKKSDRVSIRKNISQESLENILRILREKDQQSKKIASNGFRFFKK